MLGALLRTCYPTPSTAPLADLETKGPDDPQCRNVAKVSAIEREIDSQPECWRRATVLAGALAGELPSPGKRLAVIGCGTSLYMAQAYAVARETSGVGETDAFPASEMPRTRNYDAVLAVSRSGTTSEVVGALERVPPSISTHAVIGVSATPIADLVDRPVVLDFADEESVVQTRFATTALVFMLTSIGLDVAAIASDAERALAAQLPVDPGSSSSFVFLGRGWTVGLANEAALKLREAALAWAESYPALEYRHGPIALAGAGTVAWAIGDVGEELLTDIRSTGASVVASDRHPLAELVLVQRMAVALAQARSLDPDNPRNLTRSVVLSSQRGARIDSSQ
jgi:fructoselysine-6-P-deglycase FrlB-like protein